MILRFLHILLVVIYFYSKYVYSYYPKILENGLDNTDSRFLSNKIVLYSEGSSFTENSFMRMFHGMAEDLLMVGTPVIIKYPPGFIAWTGTCPIVTSSPSIILFDKAGICKEVYAPKSKYEKNVFDSEISLFNWIVSKRIGEYKAHIKPVDLGNHVLLDFHSFFANAKHAIIGVFKEDEIEERMNYYREWVDEGKFEEFEYFYSTANLKKGRGRILMQIGHVPPNLNLKYSRYYQICNLQTTDPLILALENLNFVQSCAQFPTPQTQVS